ncbi:MAG: FKBP-type peptidyl-prolyl cis-trans isomerase, partial [Moraxella sp.]
LFVPPALGYGEAGNAEIEPNSLLIFDVELLQVNPTAGK